MEAMRRTDRPVFPRRRGPRLRLSGTLAKHLAVFVAAVLKDQKKTRGKTRMVRMLKENKPLKFFTVPSDRLREFSSEAGNEDCSM